MYLMDPDLYGSFLAYGFSLTIALSTKKMNLMKYGKAAYNHVIVMSPEASCMHRSVSMTL